MHKHALALGYFFLSVFCIFTSSQSFQLCIPLLTAALVAAILGLVFFFSACAPLVHNWLVEGARLVRLARELPTHPSTFENDLPA